MVHNIVSFLGLDLAFLTPIADALNIIIIPIVALLGTFGTIYSIILGVNMAKADSADKRAAAKKKIVSVIVSVISVIALLYLLQFLFNNLPTWVNGTPSK